jgi:hypothetical protein
MRRNRAEPTRSLLGEIMLRPEQGPTCPLVPVRSFKADARSKIVAKNTDLLARNQTIPRPLVPISGRETDRIMENIFMENYYRVISNMHCKIGEIVLRMLFRFLAWKTGAAICLKADEFVQKLSRESSIDITDAYEQMMKPENPIQECTKLVLREENTSWRPALNVCSRAMSILSDMAGIGILNAVLAGVGKLFSANRSVIFGYSADNTLDKMLADDTPNSGAVEGLDVIINIIPKPIEKPTPDAAQTANPLANPSVSRRRARQEPDDDPG